LADDGLFEIKDESKLNEVVPLVPEPYTYDNMVSNPIIKPISETDRSLRDLDEIEYKKLIDIRRLQEKINIIISDVPSYQDSSFVADLIKLAQSMDDVIKIQDIEISVLKDCIRKVHNEVHERYYIQIEGKEEYVEPESVIPEGSVANYLDKLCSNTDLNISAVAQAIKDLFIKKEGPNEKENLQNAGIEYYQKEADKKRRQIAARIIRMEIN
jgi:hypothetical protein